MVSKELNLCCWVHFKDRSLPTDCMTILQYPCITSHLLVLRSSALIWTCCFGYLGDPALNEVLKHRLTNLTHVGSQPSGALESTSCKCKYFSSWKNYFDCAVELTDWRRAAVLLTLSGRLHVGFCMFTQHLKTNLMQLWFETKLSLEKKKSTNKKCFYQFIS